MSHMEYWLRRAWLVVAVAAVVIVLDQWTKGLVRQNIEPYTYIIPYRSLGEYYVYEHVYNYGAAFGILRAQNLNLMFIIIAAVVAVAILVYVRYLPMEQRLVRFLLGLQLGGAIGNQIDRINQGYVTDFIKIGIPDVYYWPNFNIADSAIVSGVIALGIFVIWDDIRQSRRGQETKDAVEPSTPL